MVKETLDVMGKVCPYPVIAMLEKIKELKEGDELEVLTDEPLAIRSIPMEARRLGLRVGIQKVEHGWKIILSR